MYAESGKQARSSTKPGERRTSGVVLWILGGVALSYGVCGLLVYNAVVWIF